MIFTFGTGEGSKQELYEALQYSGLVTKDMTFKEMCQVLAAEYPEIKDIIKNGVLNTDLASGEISTTSKCAGNTTGTSSKVALTLIDGLVGKLMTLTFRGYTTTSIYNKDIERYAYVECDGVRVATVDLLSQYQANKDETITVNFTPTVNAIYIGTYVRRTSDSAQSSQSDVQTAEIISLQVV